MEKHHYSPQYILQKAQSAAAANQQLVKHLKNRVPANFDDIMANLHYMAFQNINCLDCGNCCRSLGPRITQNDIETLSKYLRKKQKVFIDIYLRVDEDGDHVFKTMPCPFLGPDNYCSVYTARPKACREYPHTNHKKMVKLLPLALKNAETCPAVGLMFDALHNMV
jgi:uncharacterized protein